MKRIIIQFYGLIIQFHEIYNTLHRMKKNRNGKGKEVRKPISDNFAPKRLAINFDPPMLIMEYLVIDSGKLYHHKMRLDSVLRKPKVSRDDVLLYVKNKHHLYFANGKVKDPQVLKFIDKILMRKGLITQAQALSNNYKQTSANIVQRKEEEDDDFQYLNDDEDDYYQQDYEDYEDPSNFVNQSHKPAPQKAPQQQGKKNAFLTYCQEYEDEEEGQEGSAQASWDLDMDENADFV